MHSVLYYSCLDIFYAFCIFLTISSFFIDPPQCLNLTELLNHYGLSPQSTISPKQFTYLCPALLYQIDSRLCIRHLEYEDMQSEQQASTGTSTFIYTIFDEELSANGIFRGGNIGESWNIILSTYIVRDNCNIPIQHRGCCKLLRVLLLMQCKLMSIHQFINWLLLYLRKYYGLKCLVFPHILYILS